MNKRSTSSTISSVSLEQHPERIAGTDLAKLRCPPWMVSFQQSLIPPDFLTDSAAQIVEVIWPLSSSTCRSSAALGSNDVLTLRGFIQETLKRSRTSYSTLQVALYYLIVIKPHIPDRDFTQEQFHDDGPLALSLQCGRRMFLTALILASKYLQDRNYSNQAWSRLSGLSVQDVNTNEMAFLSAVDWRLHISERIFQRWADIVLQYTTITSTRGQSHRSPTTGKESNVGWHSIIPRLTPQLDTIEINTSRPTPTSCPLPAEAHLVSNVEELAGVKHPQAVVHVEGLPPTPPYDLYGGVSPPADILRTTSQTKEPRPTLGHRLPTPMMTPPSSGENTPAASTHAISPRKSSFARALAHADRSCTARLTLDASSAAVRAARALLLQDCQRPNHRQSTSRGGNADALAMMSADTHGPFRTTCANSKDFVRIVANPTLREGNSEGVKERALRCQRRRIRLTSDGRSCPPYHPLSARDRGITRESCKENKVSFLRREPCFGNSQAVAMAISMLPTIDTALQSVKTIR